MDWKAKVDPIIKAHLEREIKESLKSKEAYCFAKDPSKAQLWCVIGNLSKQIFDLNLKLNYLEKALKDTLTNMGKKKK